MFEETRERFFPVELAPGVIARAVDRQVIAPVWAELSDEMETPFAELGLYTMPGEQRPRTQLLHEVHGRVHREYILPVLIAKLKAGFHITAVSLDERFGAQVQLTYFFDQERYEGFAQAFSLDGFERPPRYGDA